MLNLGQTSHKSSEAHLARNKKIYWENRDEILAARTKQRELNRDLYNEQQRARVKDKWQRYRALLAAIKLSQGCCVCGYADNEAALAFDHIKGKKLGNISTMVTTHGWAAIQTELAKCQVICANCHTIATAERRRRKEQGNV